MFVNISARLLALRRNQSAEGPEVIRLRDVLGGGKAVILDTPMNSICERFEVGSDYSVWTGNTVKYGKRAKSAYVRLMESGYERIANRPD